MTRAASRVAARPCARQALTPIPSAPTLDAINHALLARMDARLTRGRDGAGETIGARFAVEAATWRPLPRAFVAEATTFVTVSPRALVRLAGAAYSVPCRWAGLDLLARDRRRDRDDCRARRHAHPAPAQALR